MQAASKSAHDQLNTLLGGEYSADEQGLTRLQQDITAVEGQVFTLQSWRSSNELDARTWEDGVKKRFSRLGHDMDDVHMANLAAEGEMKWAEDQAAAHLQAHLGAELEGMSEGQQAAIGNLAARAADDIRALLNNAALGEAEKAKQLAAIKKTLREESAKVLKGNVEVDLTSNEDERLLQMAKAEIEQTIAKMASIQEGAASSGPSREQVQGELRS